MVVAEILAAIGTKLGGLFTTSSFMPFQLFRASEAPDVANLQFLTCLQVDICG